MTEVQTDVDVHVDEQPYDITEALKKRDELERGYYDAEKAKIDGFRAAVIEFNRIDLLMGVILGYQVADCHLKMLAFQEAHNRTLTLAPRGIGKSTALTIVRVLFELVKNPEIRILIASNTQIQSEVFLREIKQHMESNQRFIDIFGNLVGTKWDTKEIILASRKGFYKESNVTCLGVGGGIIGRHYDLIIGDDLVDEENSRTDVQREKFKIWFYKVLDPTLEPSGREFLHGTRYYPNDHYEHIIKTSSTKDADGNQIPKSDLTTEDFKYISLPAIKSDNTSIWPEKMSLQWLQAKRNSMGRAIFDSQYMNSTKAMEGKIFQYNNIRYYDILPDQLVIIQGVDLAISKTETSDYFSITTIGKDEFNRIYLIDMFKERMSFLAQFRTIVAKWQQFRGLRVFVEANAYQMAQVHMLAAKSEVPVVPVITLKDKVTRAWHLAAKFEAAQVFFPRFGVQNFIDTLIAFPDCDHDDDFDSFEIAVSGAFRPIRKSRKHFGVI